MSKFKELVNGSRPVLVDFHADWCGPCKMMPPILKEVKNKLGDRVSVIKIDVDRNAQLAGRLDIQSVPTLVIYRQGKVVWRRSGVVPANTLIEALTAAE